MSKFSEAFLKLKTFVLDFSNGQLTSLNGILDKVPEPMKKSFTDLRDALQAKRTELETMLATVPADDDAGTALNNFLTGYMKLREHCDGLMTSCQAALATNATTGTALQGLQKQVTDGDLISKAKVTELTTKAHEDGVASVMPLITGMRKSAVALAGLPEAGEDVLKLPADQFDTRLKAAQANVKSMTDTFGFALNGKGTEWVKECAWQEGTAFQGSMKKIEALLPARASGGTGDPMLGGGLAGAPKGKVHFA